MRALVQGIEQSSYQAAAVLKLIHTMIVENCMYRTNKEKNTSLCNVDFGCFFFFLLFQVCVSLFLTFSSFSVAVVLLRAWLPAAVRLDAGRLKRRLHGAGLSLRYDSHALFKCVLPNM